MAGHRSTLPNVELSYKWLRHSEAEEKVVTCAKRLLQTKEIICCICVCLCVGLATLLPKEEFKAGNYILCDCRQ